MAWIRLVLLVLHSLEMVSPLFGLVFVLMVAVPFASSLIDIDDRNALFPFWLGILKCHFCTIFDYFRRRSRNQNNSSLFLRIRFERIIESVI